MGISGDTGSFISIASGNIWKYCGRKVELNGLLYVIERLPQGIEECRFINLTSAVLIISRQLFLQKKKKLLSDR
jgi:hypothetical protein